MSVGEPIGRGDLHVWYWITDAVSGVELDDAVATLSPDERARYERFMFEADRRDFACAHALLRRTLSRHGGFDPASWTFDIGPHGKPSLSADSAARLPVAFNLSHTRGLVACVIGLGADRQLGIDVERSDRPIETDMIADRYFSESEQRHLRLTPASDRAASFFDLWTLKEAYLKARGTGLTELLHRTTVDLSTAGAIGFQPDASLERQSWTLALAAPAPHFRLAVAGAGDGIERISLRSADLTLLPVKWLRRASVGVAAENREKR